MVQGVVQGVPSTVTTCAEMVLFTVSCAADLVYSAVMRKPLTSAPTGIVNVRVGLVTRSSHDWKIQVLPWASFCGDVAVMVWVEPTPQM